MHVRLGTRLAPFVLLAAALASAACRAAPPDVTVEWRMAPASPVVDRPVAVGLTLLDAGQQPVVGATLDIEAHMSHPGMAPVIVRAADRGAGVYDARLSFTMSGDWVAVVSGTLPGGQAIRRRAAAFTVVMAE